MWRLPEQDALLPEQAGEEVQPEQELECLPVQGRKGGLPWQLEGERGLP